MRRPPAWDSIPRLQLSRRQLPVRRSSTPGCQTEGGGGALSDRKASVIFEVVASHHQYLTPTREEHGQQHPPPSLDSVLSWYQRLRKPPPPPHHLERGYNTITRKKRGMLGAGADNSIGPPPGQLEGGYNTTTTTRSKRRTILVDARRVDDSIKPPPPPPPPPRRVSQLTSSCWDQDASLLAVVGVKSAVANFDRRQAIRETWARAELGLALSGRVCLLFVTGMAGSELPREAVAALELEMAVYGDLFGTGFSTGYYKDGGNEAAINNKPRGEVLSVYEDHATKATTMKYHATAGTDISPGGVPGVDEDGAAKEATIPRGGVWNVVEGGANEVTIKGPPRGEVLGVHEAAAKHEAMKYPHGEALGLDENDTKEETAPPPPPAVERLGVHDAGAKEATDNPRDEVSGVYENGTEEGTNPRGGMLDAHEDGTKKACINVNDNPRGGVLGVDEGAPNEATIRSPPGGVLGVLREDDAANEPTTNNPAEMLGVYQDGATKATNNPPRDILSVHGDATNEGTNPPASEALGMFKNRPAEAIDPRSDILGVHKNGLAEATNNPPGEVLGVHNDGAANEATNNPRGEVLRVRDGYDKLIDKTVGFMETAMGEMPHYEYLVMMDDDVYLRLDRLSEWLDKRVPQADEQGFYAGQVWADQFGRPIRPRRYPGTKNAVSRETWPLDALPPFAIGPHYILSRDCVEFITDNKNTLRAVGTLEDVSIALWMLALQVHPSHLDGFTDAKAGGCLDHAMSLASVGPTGIWAAHANLAAGRPLCHGFDLEVWQLR